MHKILEQLEIILKYIAPIRGIIFLIIIIPLSLGSIYLLTWQADQKNEEYLSVKKQYQLIHEVDSINGVVARVIRSPIRYGGEIYLVLDNGAKLTNAMYHAVYMPATEQQGLLI